MPPELGTLKKVAIKELWKYEAADFTPWLIREENISKLAAAIGVELEESTVFRRTQKSYRVAE